MSEQCETCRTEAIYFEEPCAECGFDPFGELKRLKNENIERGDKLVNAASKIVDLRRNIERKDKALREVQETITKSSYPIGNCCVRARAILSITAAALGNAEEVT